MRAVGELVLVLGLLVSAHCEVRARDPEVEEEEELGGRGGRLTPPQPGETPLNGPMGNYRARQGNWCLFVYKHEQPMEVAAGTEKQSQRIRYRLSPRPVDRHREAVVSSLGWSCCPGHRGRNCEETVSGPQLGSTGPEPKWIQARAPDPQAQQHGDPNREQNDFYGSINLYDTSYPNQDTGHDPHRKAQPAFRTYPHRYQRVQHQQPPDVDEEEVAALTDLDIPTIPPVPNDPMPPVHNDPTPPVLNYPTPPVPHMMDLVMSQLKPLLDGFKHSLENLNEQVGNLAQDVEQLKAGWRLEEPRRDDGAEEVLEAKLDEVLQQVGAVQRQMEVHRSNMENQLHSQHAMMHYNLTIFKTDVDMKLKRHQKMLQVSLQAMNATLTELKLDQEQLHEDEPENHLPTPPPPLHPSETTALWEAITRLDNMVVNNTVKVDGLMEDMEVTSADVQQLSQHLKQLEQQINQTARNSQVLFMETGLEVEDSKVKVLRQVEELAGNLTQHKQALQETESDVDYLFNTIYKHNSSTDCNCKDLKVAVVNLERGVANVTMLAKENRLTLDDISEVGPWGGASEWEPAVEDLRHKLQLVEECLTLEQNKTRSLEQNLTQLGGSVSVLQETDKKLKLDIRVLSESFRALLKDAVRHSEVLQLLMGEEVLEFLEWPLQDQEAHSIPALKEHIRILQEQLGSHRDMDEVPAADQPSSSSHHLPVWLPGAMRRSEGGVPARERQLLHLHPEGRQHAGDGGDLWNLKKMVEKLEQRLIQLEETPCSCNSTVTQQEVPTAELQEEVMWLKRGLEEHLRVFKHVFSNADVLVASDATLELDKLWQLMKKKDEKKGGGGGKGQKGAEGRRRIRREATGANVPSSQSGVSLLFVARSPRIASNAAVTFQPSLNRGQFYSNAGVFTAPEDGIYLFIITLDLRPGPAHVVLKTGDNRGGAPVSLQREDVMEAGPGTGVGLKLLKEGEEVRLELRRGEWVESEDNVFVGLLLHPTT
ncbi:multimerin-2a isoform X2 [Melanotaenia boesemani]|uniref:multimerin-2a isoform X2 n=1 Tax=Melanotaenia boesemani TaxID=1250792 RepID=UPI001C05CABB|nr:multimerin-2a isoform X2 [Melanotaenia boesemani]